MLTIKDVQAAQRNELAGIRAVLDAMESRIASLATHAASSFASNPSRRADYVEEFRQDAAVTLFESLPKFEGDSVDKFFAFMYRNIEGALRGKATEQRHPGVDRWAMMTFKDMVTRADGDLYKAERLAQTAPPKGQRLSADRAHAARLSWQGTRSLDAPRGEDGQSIADFLVADSEAHPEVRPKVGHGAALEALSVLQRYASVAVGRMTPGEFGANLPALVVSLEDVVIVPREAVARRAVLDAMAILRSAVSTTTDGELIEDLRDASDERADERADKISKVHSALDDMATRQADALRHSYGIGGATCYGTGDAGDLDGLAEALGCSPIQARDARTRGHKSFAKRYIVLTARNALHAEALTAAAAVNLGRGGRK